MSLLTDNMVDTRNYGAGPGPGFTPSVIVYNETWDALTQGAPLLNITTQTGCGVEDAVKTVARHDEHGYLCVEFNAANGSLHEFREILTNPEREKIVLLVTNADKVAFRNKTKGESYEILLLETKDAGLKLVVFVSYEQ